MIPIVIGSSYNYSWEQIEHWWMSLRLSGFEGDIHLINYSDRPEFSKMLKQASIIEHKRNLTWGQVVIDRFRDTARLVSLFNPETWIIFTDTNDLVFQYDPMRFLSGVEQDIVVASEGVRFEKNLWTRGNLQNSFPQYWETMRQKYFYNAGSFACKAGVLHHLGEEVYELCDRNHNTRNHDQVALNMLLQLEPRYRDRTLFTGPNDLWCYCAASSMFAKPEDSISFEGQLPIVRNGKCYVKNGKMLTCMFHHYTRDLTTKTQVHRWIMKEWAAAREKA